MRPPLLSLVLVSIALAGCGGHGSSSSDRTFAQESALRAVRTVVSFDPKKSQGIVKPSASRRGRASRAADAPVYDESLGLWSTEEETETQTITHYWLDPRAVRPAGTRVMNHRTENSGDTWIEEGEATITAGRWKGMRRITREVRSSGNAWSAVDETSFADGSRYRVALNSDGEGTSTYEMDDFPKSGAFSKLRIASIRGQGERRSFETKAFLASVERDENWAGTGTVVAKDPSASATFEVDGHEAVTVHYADGSSETFAGES